MLVAAHRSDAERHAVAAAAIIDAVTGDQLVGLPDAAVSGFVRIVTNPRIWEQPSSTHQALEYLGELFAQPRVSMLRAGPSQWAIFERLCTEIGARGNLVTDAWLAAMAIDQDCDWVTFDHDFAKFPGLRWRQPRADSEASGA